jgi:hypothetical protein
MSRITHRTVEFRKHEGRAIEPLWPPFMAMLGIGGLYSTLPPSLLGGAPRWLLAVIVIAFSAMILIFHYRGDHVLHQKSGYLLNGVVTAAMIFSLGLLIQQVAGHTIQPERLLLSAATLWLSNILVFASWYWRLDGGGPHERARTLSHTDGAFLFPQMTMPPDAKLAAGEQDWSPRFVDYLFLAFNTSTAFSPTDVPVLSRWAKLVMMVQAMISLVIIALLAGRAVNIL